MNIHPKIHIFRKVKNFIYKQFKLQKITNL